MHPVTVLVGATFLLLVGFLVWNLLSVRRHRFGKPVSGIGGENDPLSGKTAGIRSPDEIRASLEDAVQEEPPVMTSTKPHN